MTKQIKADVVVIGSGPGGYTAAFRAADLGKQVVLIERFSTLGGVCLNVGCIPSKALLHIAKVVDEAHEMASQGVTFSKPELDNKKMLAWKNAVVTKFLSYNLRRITSRLTEYRLAKSSMVSSMIESLRIRWSKSSSGTRKAPAN